MIPKIENFQDMIILKSDSKYGRRRWWGALTLITTSLSIRGLTRCILSGWLLSSVYYWSIDERKLLELRNKFNAIDPICLTSTRYKVCGHWNPVKYYWEYILYPFFAKTTDLFATKNCASHQLYTCPTHAIVHQKHSRYWWGSFAKMAN